MANKLKVTPIDLAKPGDAQLLMHNAIVVGFVHGVEGVTIGDMLVIGRHRPYIPPGDDPISVNRECARRFAVMLGDHNELLVYELDADQVSRVVPFVDLELMLRAEDERANAAQRANKKPSR